MKKILSLMIPATVFLLVSGCFKVSELSEDKKSFFELSREFRCENTDDDDKETMLVDEIDSRYAYAEDNMIWVSVYDPLFSIKGVPYLEESGYQLTRDINIPGGGGIRKASGKG